MPGMVGPPHGGMPVDLWMHQQHQQQQQQQLMADARTHSITTGSHTTMATMPHHHATNGGNGIVPPMLRGDSMAAVAAAAVAAAAAQHQQQQQQQQRARHAPDMHMDEAPHVVQLEPVPTAAMAAAAAAAVADLSHFARTFSGMPLPPPGQAPAFGAAPAPPPQQQQQQPRAPGGRVRRHSVHVTGDMTAGYTVGPGMVMPDAAAGGGGGAAAAAGGWHAMMAGLQGPEDPDMPEELLLGGQVMLLDPLDAAMGAAGAAAAAQQIRAAQLQLQMQAGAGVPAPAPTAGEAAAAAAGAPQGRTRARRRSAVEGPTGYLMIGGEPLGALGDGESESLLSCFRAPLLATPRAVCRPRVVTTRPLFTAGLPDLAALRAAHASLTTPSLYAGTKRSSTDRLVDLLAGAREGQGHHQPTSGGLRGRLSAALPADAADAMAAAAAGPGDAPPGRRPAAGRRGSAAGALRSPAPPCALCSPSTA